MSRQVVDLNVVGLVSLAAIIENFVKDGPNLHSVVHLQEEEGSQLEERQEGYEELKYFFFRFFLSLDDSSHESLQFYLVFVYYSLQIGDSVCIFLVYLVAPFAR